MLFYKEKSPKQGEKKSQITLKKPKAHFVFEVEGHPDQLKVDFINSELIQSYNELRNLEKMVSGK